LYTKNSHLANISHSGAISSLFRSLAQVLSALQKSIPGGDIALCEDASEFSVVAH